MAGTETTLEGFQKSVYDALDLKEQRKALRGAMRKEATRVRGIAKQAVFASGLGRGTHTDITKGIYQRVYPARYGAGFMVSVKWSSHVGSKAIHKNRQGKEKPVLMWAADGTKERRVGKRKARQHRQSWTGRRYATYARSGHSTGAMRKYGFMDGLEDRVAPTIETNLFANFNANLDKAIRKQGLK